MIKKHLPATTTGSSVALRKVSNSLAITNKLLATIDERPTEEDWTWWNGLSDDIKRLLTAHIYHGDSIKQNYRYKKLQEIGIIHLINPKEDLKEILDLRYFYCHGAYDDIIHGLKNISFLTNLTKLYLKVSEISDINPLRNLINLTELDLSWNKITNISPLANLTNLTDLSLASNEITDISPLANLTNLAKLSLGINEITDITPLANLTNLTKLYLWINEISETDINWLQQQLPNCEIDY